MALVQYGGCVGITGGFNHTAANGDLGRFKLTVSGTTIISVLNVPTTAGNGGPWGSTPVGGYQSPLFSACTMRKGYVQYRPNTLGGLVSSGQTNFFAEGYLTGPHAATPHFHPHACKLDQLLEVRFRLGTWDTVALTRAADGYIEVRVDGNVLISISGIALGHPTLAGYDRLYIGDGSVPDTEGLAGMTSMYFKDVDSYGSSGALLNESYAGQSDATVFKPTGTWDKFIPPGVIDNTSSLPFVLTGQVFGNTCQMTQALSPTILNSAITAPTPIMVNSAQCCDTKNGSSAGNVSTGPMPQAGPYWTPACTGGGAVPTAPDLVLSEAWDY